MFPSVTSVTGQSFGAASGDKTVTLPTTAAGDLLILIVGCDDDNVALTGPGGSWVEVYNADTGNEWLGIWALIATGAESGGSVTINISAAEMVDTQIYRIAAGTHHADLSPATDTVTFGITGDSSAQKSPPSVAAPGGSSADLLSIVGSNLSANDTDTFACSGYSDEQRTTQGSGASGHGLYTLRRTVVASSEDAGNISWGGDTTPGSSFSAFCILVKGLKTSGAITALLPAATASLSVTHGDDGLATEIAATLPVATASLTATQEHAVAITASLPAATASLTGTMHPAGAIAASLPAATASLTASQKHTGAIAASLPYATAALSASQRIPSVITATLRTATASLTATMHPTGAIAASLPAATAALVAAQKHTATIAASLPAATASLSAVTGQMTATIAATLQTARASLTATMHPTGAIAASLPVATASLLASMVPPIGAAITATLRVATASLAAVQFTPPDLLPGKRGRFGAARATRGPNEWVEAGWDDGLGWDEGAWDYNLRVVSPLLVDGTARRMASRPAVGRPARSRLGSGR